jgi:hypothetical protein
MTQIPPFAVPSRLGSDMAGVRDYWNSLKRGENMVPFADDVVLSALGGIEGRLLLIDVFEKPQRFRVAIVGQDIRDWYGGDMLGKFTDELEAKGPLKFFAAQASATVEAKQPSYYNDGFARLLLPLWGGGYVSQLLAAVARA